jgi:hypothetical protein
MSAQHTDGGWQALRGAPQGIPPICAACGEISDRGVVYDDGPERWLFLCHDCVADVARVAQAEQERQP